MEYVHKHGAHPSDAHARLSLENDCYNGVKKLLSPGHLSKNEGEIKQFYLMFYTDV
jgi:hypothetical protein